jgi:hypothetical protein
MEHPLQGTTARLGVLLGWRPNRPIRYDVPIIRDSGLYEEALMSMALTVAPDSQSRTKFIDTLVRAVEGRDDLGVLREEILFVIAAVTEAEQITDRLVPEPRVPDLAGYLVTATRVAEARNAIVQVTELLTSAQVSEALGAEDPNARRKASQLRRKGLLGLSFGRRSIRYPAFQFDFTRGTTRPIVLKVNKLLDGEGDPWGVASWWVRSDTRLHGKSPRELLGTDRENDLLVMAQSDVELF